MKKRRIMIPVLVLCFLLAALAVGAGLLTGCGTSTDKSAAGKESKQSETKDQGTGEIGLGEGPMSLGEYNGEVVYDEEDGFYYLEFQGSRFPFKTSPIQAQEVTLDASGKDELEKNTALLYGMMGEGVLHVTILIDPDEEDEVMPAVDDIARYIKIANPKKYAGFAYTKEGGKQQRTLVKGSQIQVFDKDATPETPIVLLKGPKSGASKTAVTVMDGGKVVVEGKTYEDLYKAADLICVTLMKMLCGSSDCPDAAACATGGDCGC